jgi:hypothetical protein
MNKLILIALTLIASMQSCHLKSSEKIADTAMGEAGDIAILTDKTTWSNYGNLIDSVFSKPIEGIVENEPSFVIRRCDEGSFAGMYKKNYNLFILIHGENWPTLRSLFNPATAKHIDSVLKGEKVKLLRDKDKWAKPQEVQFLIAPKMHQFVSEFKTNSQFYLDRALAAERNSTVNSLIHYTQSSDTFFNNQLKKRGYAIRHTQNYRLSVVSDSFVGLSRYISDQHLGSYMYDEDYVDEEQFSQKYILAKRNKMMGRHISGTDRPDGLKTYMSNDTNAIKPVSKVIRFKGRYAVETRGWWEMTNDFMGGPYVLYTIHCPEINKVVSVEGNVFAPNREKNRFLRQLELIISTFECSK